MNQNELTDRDFWINYWQSKPDLVFEIPPQFPFVKELDSLIKTHRIKTLLEIGGFPGYYSIWATRAAKVESTLLDFVIHEPIVHELEKANQLPKRAIRIWETDLFTTQADSRFDLVFSNGLVEHFHDTTDIIQRHAQFLKPGGILYFTIPNFKSLNGWFQKVFDPQNYAKHNIECMDIEHLKKACVEAGLEDIEVRYTGYFTIWLEDLKSKQFWLRALRFIVWFPIKVFFKLFPINSKAFSPYLEVKARKKT